MSDQVELAVRTDLAIEPGAANVERCRFLLYARKLVTREFALRVKAELDGPGSKTQQGVAEEIGCSERTVRRALEKIGETRSLNRTPDRFDDLDLDDDDDDITDYERRRSSVSNEWYTPAPVIAAAHRVLGGIDLDPASCATANGTVRAAEYYTADDDGLAHTWKGSVWLNPPYHGLAGRFVSHLVADYERGDVTAAIALITALTTDTNWFRPLWDYTLCFYYGRIKFDSTDGTGSSNTAGSIFVYLGPQPDRFEAEFQQFGAVVERRTR